MNINIENNILEDEQRYLKEDRILYLECLNNKPLSERKTELEKKDGLILFFHVYLVCRKKT